MKILFLSTWFPFPPDNGSRIRAYHLLRTLARDHQLTLISFRPADTNRETQAESWKTGAIEVHPVAANPFRYVDIPTPVKFVSPIPVACWPIPLMAQQVAQITREKEWDAVVAFQEPVARYALQIPDVPRVLDVDVSSSYGRYQELLNANDGIARLRAWAGWRKALCYERRLFHQFDACTLVMPEEASWLGATIEECRVEVNSNGVDCEHNRPRVMDKSPNTLVYNGSLTYSANYDAMAYFLARIYPRIQGCVPGVSMTITGSLDGVDLSGLELDNSVNLSGYVDDIRPVVSSSSVCVIPLRQGGGTRIKILEAMALGTPVISTPKGAEGLKVADGEHLILADDPAEFAARTVALLKNAGMRQRLASSARQLVEERYDWRRIGQRFVHLVEDVASRRRARGVALS